MSETKLMEATDSSEENVARRRKPFSIEVVKFLLFACCIKAFSFAIWHRALERRLDQVFRAMYPVMLKCSSGLKSQLVEKRWLTHRVDVLTVSINLRKNFAGNR